jgi:hypothetical protein
VEVTPKPVPKFLPHNQIIKATFFEDQAVEMDLEERNNGVLTSKSTRSPATQFTVKNSEEGKMSGVMRVPEKYKHFPTHHKGKSKFGKPILYRKPKSLFQETPDIVMDNKKEEEESENYAQGMISEGAGDTKILSSFYNFHRSSDRKLLQNEDDMDVKNTGPRLKSKDSVIDSQLEKPNEATMGTPGSAEEVEANEANHPKLIPSRLQVQRPSQGAGRPDNEESLPASLPSRLSAKSLYQNARTVRPETGRPASSQDRYQEFLAKYQQ